MDKKHPSINMRHTAHLFFSILFVVMLLLPFMLSLRPVRGARTVKTKKQASPGIDLKAILAPEYYRAWSQFANYQLASDHTFAQLKNWVDYRLFAMSDAKDVHVGRNGWLFDQPSIQDFRKNGCDRMSELLRLILDLRTVAEVAEAGGRKFTFTVVPNKSTIYPEFVGVVPRSPECNQSTYELLLAEHARRPIKGFVRLDEALLRAKGTQKLLYDPTGTYWNEMGANQAARVLLPSIAANGQPSDFAETDLAQAILYPDKSNVQGDSEQLSSDKRRLSSAIVYGGPALKVLLPHIMPHFDRLDIIDAVSLPSLNHKENIAAYDAILVVVPEAHLLDLDLKLDRLCKMMEADTAVVGKQEINLASMAAKHGVALNLEADHLNIKSMGQVAEFALPALPGSDSQAMRVLRLELFAPHSDMLSWSFTDATAYGGQRSLQSGKSKLFIPLPFQSSTHMRINAGRRAGIFKLQHAVLLTFGQGIQAGPFGRELSFPILPDAPAPMEAAPPEQVPPSIVLNDIQSGRIFQRRGASCDVFISGSFRGKPNTIEAQVLRHDTNRVVVPWTVVDATPSNGIFMGVLRGVPQGGWYRLAVRFQDRPKIAHRGQSPWGVGLLTACIGQSNMKEWFFSGGGLKPHDLLSVHRNGQWVSTAGLGNGAVAFGNRLVNQLGIPIGLLDYAVNGSGLRREADWGTGYWADRSETGIYRRFIQGITAAGGAVEYLMWMQGEADAARKRITGYQYGHTLKSFILQQVRKDVVNGSRKNSLPFLIVGMVKRPIGDDQAHQAIRDALVAATDSIPDCYLAATTLDLQNLGRQHLSPEAYTELGVRVAQTVLYLLGKADYHRGPTIDEIKRPGNTIIDIGLQHHGGNDFAPLFGITGFEVLQGSKSLSIAQAQRIDPRTIRIRLNQSVDGPLIVRYLYGAMPDSTGAVKDNSTLRLPLEPFIRRVE